MKKENKVKSLKGIIESGNVQAVEILAQKGLIDEFTAKSLIAFINKKVEKDEKKAKVLK